MKPPAGRIAIGDRVEAPGRRAGKVIAERQMVSNGAWLYQIAFDAGGNGEFLDFELRKLQAA